MVKYFIFMFILLLPYRSNAVISDKEETKYCTNTDVKRKCSAGDIIRTNLSAAGKYCDFEKQIVQHKGLVLCVYIGKERETKR